ncbi:MAG TPA: hypothetical protein VJT73_21220 [Polyangiaceae bacterium]|nr:hypothetical protein [Polyangiaceae bacterium]
MTTDQLSLSSSPLPFRLARAFWLQYNVILLFGAVAFSLALRTQWPLAIGAVVELAWLVIASRSPGLQRWMAPFFEDDLELVPESGPMWNPPSAVRGLSRTLPGAHIPALGMASGEDQRLLALRRTHQEIRAAELDSAGMSLAELEATRDRLDDLLRTFERLSVSQQKLVRFFQSASGETLASEVAKATAALATEKDATMRMALRQTLGLAQRRVQQREQMSSTLRAVELQMATIERSFAYITASVLRLGSARELKAELDAIASQVVSVDSLEADVRAVLPHSVREPLSGPTIPIVLDSE